MRDCRVCRFGLQIVQLKPYTLDEQVVQENLYNLRSLSIFGAKVISLKDVNKVFSLQNPKSKSAHSTTSHLSPLTSHLSLLPVYFHKSKNSADVDHQKSNKRCKHISDAASPGFLDVTNAIRIIQD